MLNFLNPVKIAESLFGSTPEPVCETADLLCQTLEGYGIELHSPEMLVNTAQGLSDMTGLSEEVSYLTVVTGVVASTVAAVYGAVTAGKSIMNRSGAKSEVKSLDADVIAPVSTVDAQKDKKEQKKSAVISEEVVKPVVFSGASSSMPVETPVVVALKPSHQLLVDQYANAAHQDAVAKMTGNVLAAFNELSDRTVVAFGNPEMNKVSNILKFNKLDAEQKIAMLQNMERMVVKSGSKLTQ